MTRKGFSKCKVCEKNTPTACHYNGICGYCFDTAMWCLTSCPVGEEERKHCPYWKNLKKGGVGMPLLNKPPESRELKLRKKRIYGKEMSSFDKAKGIAEKRVHEELKPRKFWAHVLKNAGISYVLIIVFALLGAFLTHSYFSGTDTAIEIYAVIGSLFVFAALAHAARVLIHQFKAADWKLTAKAIGVSLLCYAIIMFFVTLYSSFFASIIKESLLMNFLVVMVVGAAGFTFIKGKGWAISVGWDYMTFVSLVFGVVTAAFLSIVFVVSINSSLVEFAIAFIGFLLINSIAFGLGAAVTKTLNVVYHTLRE